MVTREFIPRPWQGPMVDFGLSIERSQSLGKMGMGKGSASLAIIDTRMLTTSLEKTVVFAPLRVARSTWPEEARKWANFQHLRVKFIGEWTLPEQKFLRALRALQKLQLQDKHHPDLKPAQRAVEVLRPPAAAARLRIINGLDVQCVHYDVAPQFIEILKDEWPFQMGVCDEASRVRSFRLKQGGRRAAALSEIAHKKTRYWLNLSGAIVPNGLENLWGPTWFIDHGHRLGRSFDAFEARWFGYSRAQDAVHAHKTKIKRIAFPHAQTEITDLIKDVSLAFNPKDWFAIKAPIVVPVFIDLPPDARKRYKEMERDLFTHIGGHDIEAFAASGKMIKCIAEGTEVLTDQGWIPIEEVTLEHKVWDGECWVSTLGSICNGYMPVVRCWGVQMTPDHRVMTTSGWREAREILDGESTKRYGRPNVRLPDCLAAGGVKTTPGQQERSRHLVVPLCVRSRIRSTWGYPSESGMARKDVLRLQVERTLSRGSEDARNDRASGLGVVVSTAIPVSQPHQQRLAQLRRTWDQRMQALERFFRQLLGRYGSGVGSRLEHRKSQRQRELHPKELHVGDRGGTIQQQAGDDQNQYAQRRDDAHAGSTEIRDQVHHSSSKGESRVARQGPVHQDEPVAKVYEIVNAGPRQRFVARGEDGKLLVVHNCQQLANGGIYTGSDAEVERGIFHWVEAHQEKLDALESIIEENDGETILVAFHFKPDLVRLKKRFPHGRFIDTKQDEDDFKAGFIPLAFAHPQSIGHGVDGFQNVCHILVFFALTFDLDPHDQMIERIGPMRQMKAGLDREVIVYQILARDTIDEMMAERLVMKRGVQDVTMENLACKPVEEVLW